MVGQVARLLDEEDHDELVASELDDLTHAEMCLLYRESTETVRFAKAQQWKTLGSSLILFAALVALNYLYPRAELFGNVLLIMSLAVSAGVIYVLAIYQVWQNTERGKLNAITARFSSLTHQVRAMKSRREANFFRYLLLSFMIAGVVMGEGIVFFVLTGSTG